MGGCFSSNKNPQPILPFTTQKSGKIHRSPSSIYVITPIHATQPKATTIALPPTTSASSTAAHNTTIAWPSSQANGAVSPTTSSATSKAPQMAPIGLPSTVLLPTPAPKARTVIASSLSAATAPAVAPTASCLWETFENGPSSTPVIPKRQPSASLAAHAANIWRAAADLKPAPIPDCRVDRIEDYFSRLTLDNKKYDGDYGYSSTTEKESDAGTPVYALTVTDQLVCVFEPAREKFIETSRSELSLPTIAEGEIYHASSISRDSTGDLTTPSELRRKKYLFRPDSVYGSAESYRELILPVLLLGSRVRDFEQRCAIVDQIGTLVLTIPAPNRRIKQLKLKTVTGAIFVVDVEEIKKGKGEQLNKKWILTCHPPTTPLPAEVRKGSLLEIMGSNAGQPRVTTALMQNYVSKKAPIGNWPLLSAIYGASAKRDYPTVHPATSTIRLAKNAGIVQLNPEQAEAVARYNCDVCPALVVESPPGSGKTMTAAAMAVSYRGPGVQLFLSTANVPVINMALALAKLDIGSLKAIHFISSEREELMTEETRSPFSVLSLAKRNEAVKEKIEQLEEQLKHAPNKEEKEKIRSRIRKFYGPVYADDYRVYFSTVDMILGRLFKTGRNGRKDGITLKLTNSVRRIVVDEASQLTESALNALILCFPKAQIVLIGDSKQLPPFKYTRGDVVSELAARSALEVMKAKMNLPVIKLKCVYRASPALMAHYSNVFYDGGLVSGKAESFKNPLSCFGARSGGSKCLFWKVNGCQKQVGTSKINEGELACLKYIINILRSAGYDEKSVMIISYYEAQRKRAEEELPEGYEVLTVDSAQGREKKIVIVLTTRTSVPTESGAFFSCPLRCNVAVSRHQEALIVLGHNAIASAPNWARILSPKYFKHVEPYN